jgi:hypothetical protein
MPKSVMETQPSIEDACSAHAMRNEMDLGAEQYYLR